MNFKKINLKDFIVVVIVMSMLLTIASRVVASPVSFDLFTTCTSGCESVGLNTGDLAGGFFVIENAGFAPGQQVSSFDAVDILTSFEFNFGDLHISSETALGVSMSFTFGDSTAEINRLSFTASEAIDPNLGDLFKLSFGPGAALYSFFSLNGTCSGSICFGSGATPPIGILDDFPMVPLIGTAIVPIPSSFLLFISSFIMLRLWGAFQFH